MATKKTTKPAAKPAARKKTVAKPTKPAVKVTVPEDPMDRSEAHGAYDKGAWAWVFKREPGEVRYWLVKTEPEVFSFDDLLRRHGRTTCWDGVRNFAARNFLRDGVKLGDRVFFYHSGYGEQEIVGECEVAREGYVDHTAFDPKHRHYDKESKQEEPQWYMVDLRAVAQYTKPVSLAQLKLKHALRDMALLRVGRLSVSPVTEKEYKVITAMAR